MIVFVVVVVDSPLRVKGLILVLVIYVQKFSIISKILVITEKLSSINISFEKLFNKTTPHKLNDSIFESNYADKILLKKVAKLEQVIEGLIFMVISYCLKLKKSMYVNYIQRMMPYVQFYKYLKDQLLSWAVLLLVRIIVCLAVSFPF